MQSNTITKRLTAGLMSIVMLLTLLPAMSTTAEAATTKDAKDFFTVTGKVNGTSNSNGTDFTAETKKYGDDTTAVVTLPVMYQGKGQTIKITAAEAATWLIVLGKQPDWMTLTESADKTTWTLTVTDTGDMPSYVNGSFLLKATPTGGGDSRRIRVYYYCFDEAKYRPSITTETLPNGNVNSSYYKSLDFNAGAYDGWAKWEFVDSKGNVTAHNADKTPLTEYGLELNVNLMMCEITGTPTKTGTVSFSLQVTTVGGTSEVKPFTIKIDPAKTKPTFEKNQKVCAEIGKDYTETPLFNMNDLISEDSYPELDRESWSATGLPEGLTMGTDGTITGTVTDGTAQKPYYVTANVKNTDTEPTTYGVGLELFVYAKPKATASETEKSAKAGEYLLWQPLADSGTEYPLWKIVSGDPTDYGLTFNYTDGSIYGTPTKDGTLTLKVQCIAQDNESKDIPNSTSDTVTLTLNIAPDRRFALDQTGSYSFPSVTVSEGDATTTISTPASRQFTVTGTGYSDVGVKVELSGTNADNFVLGGDTQKTLSQGNHMTFTVQPESGLSAGEYTATVTVSDTATENAAPSQSFEVKFEVSESTVPISITNASGLPYAVAGQKYTYQFNATGTQPYSWAIKAYNSTALPEGMSIDTNGLLTWDVPENYDGLNVPFYVTADSAGKGSIYSYTYFDVYTPVSITMQLGSETYTGTYDTDGTVILPDAYVNTNYKINDNNLMFTTDGNGTNVLSIEGVPPEGMGEWTTESDWQYFQGKPTKAGTYDFTVVAKQYANDGKTYIGEERQPVRLTVHEQLKVETATIPDAMEVGTSVSIDLNRYVSGGKAPYKFSTTSDLPDGLELSEDGMLTGTPKKAQGGSNFGIIVTDANGKVFVTDTGYPFMYYLNIGLPPLELTDASGASFINEISVGLSDAYKNKFAAGELDGGNYTLSYEWKVDEKLGDSDWVTCEKVTNTIKLDTSTIRSALEEKEKTLDEGDKVEVAFKLMLTAYGIAKTTTITYTYASAPTKPTASPSAETEGEAYTFTGTTPVQLFTTTSGSGIGIAYTTDGSTPEVEPGAASGGGITATGKTDATKLYTGTPIEVTADTTIKAVCFRIISKSGKLGGTSIGYGEVATFQYEKSTGVTVSGQVVSYGNASDAVTVTLTKSGETAATYTATVSPATGTTAPYTQDYSFTGVISGTYTLTVSKKNHVTEKCSITVGSSPISQDVSIFLLGDVGRDGSVNIQDVIKLVNHVNNSSPMTNTTQCDINGDGFINVQDVIKLINHVNNSNPLY